jgi:hypothetical protein
VAAASLRGQLARSTEKRGKHVEGMRGGMTEVEAPFIGQYDDRRGQEADGGGSSMLSIFEVEKKREGRWSATV